MKKIFLGIILILFVFSMVGIHRHNEHDKLREGLLSKGYSLSQEIGLSEPFLDKNCKIHTGYNSTWAQSSAVWCWRLIISKPKLYKRYHQNRGLNANHITKLSNL